MSGLRKTRPGGCHVEGHGHAHVKGVCRSGCSVYAEVPLTDRAYEKRETQRLIVEALSPEVGVGHGN